MVIEPTMFPISGFPGYYVKEDGTIWSCIDRHLKPFLIVPELSSHGYPRLRVKINGKAKKKTVHRIVAETFIPNPENKPQVNHLDFDKMNPRRDNLEWATNDENADHWWTHIGYERYRQKRREKRQKMIL